MSDKASSSHLKLSANANTDSFPYPYHSTLKASKQGSSSPGLSMTTTISQISPTSPAGNRNDGESFSTMLVPPPVLPVEDLFDRFNKDSNPLSMFAKKKFVQHHFANNYGRPKHLATQREIAHQPNHDQF